MDEGYCVNVCFDGRYEYNNICVWECLELYFLKYLNV